MKSCNQEELVTSGFDSRDEKWYTLRVLHRFDSCGGEFFTSESKMKIKDFLLARMGKAPSKKALKTIRRDLNKGNSAKLNKALGKG